jgi:hypothetical protein
MSSKVSMPNAIRVSLAAIAAIFVAQAVRFWFVADDAYITFRFSRNLATGAGLRYNLGEPVPVEGYSNFLWLLLAVPLERLYLDVGWWMCVGSVGCGLLLLAYVHWTLKRHFEVSPGSALLATAILATAPTMTIWATSGLETMPFALLTFATFERLVLSQDRQAWKSGALFALALGLIRTEGFAWVCVITTLGVVGRIIDGRQRDVLLPQALRSSVPELVRVAVLSFSVAATAFAAYFAWRTWYFESWVSNTTKVKVGFSLASTEAGVSYVSLYYLTTLVPLLAFLAAPWVVRRRLGGGLQVCLLAGFFPLYAIVVGGDYLPMGRLLVPGLPFAILMLGIGLDELARRMGRGLAAAAGLFALGLGAAPAYDLHLIPGSIRKAFHVRANTERFRTEVEQWSFIAKSTPRWRALGEQMAGISDSEDTWVAGAIGAKGYFSDLFIYDVGGLVNREVAERPPKKSGKKSRSPGHEKTVRNTFFLKDEPTYLRARIVSGDHRAIAAEVRSWQISADVKRVYVPETHEISPQRFLVVLRKAQLSEDTAAAWGKVVRSGQPAANKRADGRWHAVKDSKLTRAQREEIAQLEAIGYLSGSEKASDNTNVTVYDPQKARDGYNLYVSGHGTEAFLLSMSGDVLHQWSHSFKETWPKLKKKKKDRDTQWWRRAWLLDDGHLLALFEGHGLVRLDRDSNVVWAENNKAHHDVHLLPDGRIWTLTRQASVLPSVNKDKAVLEDFATLLGPRGKTLKQFSILKAVLDSEFATLFENSARKHGDLFHTNAIEVLDGSLQDKHPAFQAGNLMVSSRILNAIIVLDPRTERAVWARTGDFRHQHDPHILSNGRLLLFDNVGLSKTQSRILEIDPFTGSHLWSFTSAEDEPKFFSRTCGLAERLDNGNTLITESAAGRAVEITPDREVVWEFFNPHRTGKEGKLVATLFDVQRIDPSRCAWLGD